MGIDSGSYEPSLKLFMKLAVVRGRLGSTSGDNMRIIPFTYSTSRRLLCKPRYISLNKYFTSKYLFLAGGILYSVAYR